MVFSRLPSAGDRNFVKGAKVRALSTLILALSLAVPMVGKAFAHGGGCKQDSPPGLCCHMDNSVGYEHCH